MNPIFLKYKALGYAPSFEEEREKIYEYVYLTNKLEGNKLTLAQTTSLLDKNSITGENISLHDILEQKGMYKAVIRMLNAAVRKEPLSVELMKELNWLALGSLWRDDSSYLSAKNAGQKEGEFKSVDNMIRVTVPNGGNQNIEPLSNYKNVRENMDSLVKTIIDSKKDCITKADFLAQEIWLHQPFIDGNKRTGRLLINFMTMKEGYPFFVFDDRAVNFNNLLAKQYMEKKPGLVKSYIQYRLSEEMKNRIEQVQQAKENKGKGYRYIL